MPCTIRDLPESIAVVQPPLGLVCSLGNRSRRANPKARCMEILFLMATHRAGLTSGNYETMIKGQQSTCHDSKGQDNRAGNMRLLQYSILFNICFVRFPISSLQAGNVVLSGSMPLSLTFGGASCPHVEALSSSSLALSPTSSECRGVYTAGHTSCKATWDVLREPDCCA